ncbi:MAG: hypothetical protein RBG13Loki_1561 [Promethearchaeota archaeon CR_4]|nr:MAG: hypothetical protein RBG13Loki_1561 [Candidatus Lokiarchaeota archaeon CR_4]
MHFGMFPDIKSGFHFINKAPYNVILIITHFPINWKLPNGATDHPRIQIHLHQANSGIIFCVFALGAAFGAPSTMRGHYSLNEIARRNEKNSTLLEF